MMTLVELLERQAKDRPDKPALAYHDCRISYKNFNEQVNKLAHALLEIGLQPGERVGFMLPRIPELIITFLAVAKAQGIVVPINFELLPEKIGTIIKATTMRFLIIHETWFNLVQKAIPEGLDLSVIVVGNSSGQGHYLWSKLLENKKSTNPALDISPEVVAYLNYTSGSTGNSKGAITSHAHIFWNTMAAIEIFKITPDDVHLCMFAPFAHPHELFARPLTTGGTMVLVDHINPKTIAKTIDQYKVTCFMGLAPMYETLLHSVKESNLSSLRIVESGGMHTRKELIERFRQRFGIPILAVWGSTETTGIAIANSPGEKHIYGSIGKPCPYYEVKIVNDEGGDVGPNRIGEMIFKGPAVISEYYEKTPHHDKGFKDGWYYSGDLGKKDEEGNFYFVERKNGMMKVAGLMVYPLEIELELMRHPFVKEAAVIGIQDGLRGEVPKAVIVLQEGVTITEREIMRCCKKNLPSYKVPRVIEFRPSLPKTGSGKINKKALQPEVK